MAELAIIGAAATLATELEAIDPTCPDDGRRVSAHHDAEGCAILAEQDALDDDARHADRAPRYYQPQLASPNEDELPVDGFGEGWVMEQKFDGHRMSVRVTSGVATAWARPGAGVSVGIPTVLHPAIASCFETVPDGFYDGELVVPSGTSSDVRALVNSGKQALILFDACEVVGQDITRRSWEERRALLEGAALGLKPGGPVTVAAYAPCSQAGVEAIWAAGGEGVILKRTSAVYRPGARSKDWIKIKATEEVVLEITGFEEGKSFGAYSVMLVREVESGIETKTKTKNAEWFRRIIRGEIAVGTRIEATHYGRTRHAFRHLMAKRVEGEA